MIIYSEITGKEYTSVDECIAAEKKYKAKKEAERKAKEDHQKKLDAAYEKAMAAIDEYLELAGIIVEGTDRGYRVVYSNKDSKADEIFEDIMNAFLN